MSPSGSKKIEGPVDNLLEKSKGIIESICNEKINEILGSAVDVTSVAFEDFKIKAADVPFEKLPNNGDDMSELERYLKYINSVLYKAWKTAEKKREDIGGVKKEIEYESVGEDMEDEVNNIFRIMFSESEGPFFADMDEESQRLIRRAIRNGVIDELKKGALEYARKNNLEKKTVEELEEIIRAFVGDGKNLEKIVAGTEEEKKIIDVVIKCSNYFGENWEAPVKNETESAKKDERIPGSVVEKKLDGNGSEKLKIEAKAEQIDSREKELLDALVDARSQFAKTEYRDRSAMQRIRKAMKMPLEGKYAENPNIISARQFYETALRNYMEYQIDKLQASGLAGKGLEAEVKKIYSFFNLQETVQYYDARTQAKMDYLAEEEDKSSAKKTWDAVRLKSVQISEWYSKKVPIPVKLGLAAVAFIPGAQAFALGKRTWGAFMLVAAGGMQLDKLAQFKDRVVDRREAKKEFENISGKDGNVDFEKLKGILDEKISDIDDKLNSKNLRSGANKFAAFAGAMFLGGSVFKGAMDLAEAQAYAVDMVGEEMMPDKPFDPGNVNGGGPPETLNEVDFDRDNVNGGVPPEEFHKLGAVPVDAVEKGASAAVASSAEAVSETAKEIATAENLPAAMETLVIEKGSSFEGALIKYLSNPEAEIYKYHPELKGKNAGWIAHRLALDFVEDNKTEMPDLVHPGAEMKIKFDPAALSLGKEFEETIRIDLTDSVDLAEAKNQVSSSFPEVPDLMDHPVAENVASQVQMEDVAPVSTMEKVAESTKENWSTEPIIADDVRVDGSGVPASDLESFSEYRNEEQAYFISKMSENKHFVEKFKEIISADRKNIFGGNRELFKRTRNLNFFRNQTEIMESLPKKGRELVEKYLKQTPIKKTETFDQWMRMVVRNSIEKQG